MCVCVCVCVCMYVCIYVYIVVYQTVRILAKEADHDLRYIFIGTTYFLLPCCSLLLGLQAWATEVYQCMRDCPHSVSKPPSKKKGVTHVVLLDHLCYTFCKVCVLRKVVGKCC